MAVTLSLLVGLTNTVIANASEALVARHERSDMRDRQMAAPDVATLIRATSLTRLAMSANTAMTAL
jgi:hypothetical protein